MARRKKPNRLKQLAWAVATAIAVSAGLGIWKNLQAAYEMGKKQESYEEAYVQTTEFVREQRTANDLMRKNLDYLHEDQQRQWDAIYGDPNERRPRAKAKRRAY